MPNEELLLSVMLETQEALGELKKGQEYQNGAIAEGKVRLEALEAALLEAEQGSRAKAWAFQVLRDILLVAAPSVAVALGLRELIS